MNEKKSEKKPKETEIVVSLSAIKKRRSKN